MAQRILNFRLAGCKKIPGLSRAHFELRRGTEQEAAIYCKKDGDYREIGQISTGPGARTDIQQMYELAKQGKNDLELMEVNFKAFNQCFKSIDRYRSYTPPIRKHELTVHLFVGKPRTGKTRFAFEGNDDLYYQPIGKDMWFNGYRGQKSVLIDDFSGNLRLCDLLRFLDRYPIQVPTKGSFVWYMPDEVIVTTNFHPKDWYNYEKNNRKASELALRSRFHHLWNFDDKDDEGDPKPLNPQVYWPIMLENEWK